ncbi:hypothetical protein [Embleya sp. NBC_00896]|uniref:hypothetical protein n=1 Tax=Embleya sp. NBC_00896 TaxID=2975961 RepID=UPI002F916014|nr:hypothetical protein OG928_38755 [Embleya sp. NBC_00896]
MSDTIDPAIVKAAFTLADSAVLPALVARLGGELAPVLRQMPRLPAALTEAIRVSGDATLRAALAAARTTDDDDDDEGTHKTGPTPPPAAPSFVEFLSPDEPTATNDPVDQAGRDDLTAREVDALLDLDDPRVDARLFTGRRLGVEERARLLSGIRRDGTRGRVPDALTAVLWDSELRRCAQWLAGGMASGDPEVARVIVNRLRLHTEAGRLRVIVAVWERYGPDEAHQVLSESDYAAATRELITNALAAPDGLAVLRERLATEEAPEHIVDYLRDIHGEQSKRVTWILDDGGSLPWPHLIRSHNASALARGLLRTLTEQPDCPRELLISMLSGDLSAKACGDGPWLHEALVRGSLSGADVLHNARPAALALSILAATNDRTSPDQWASGPPRTEAKALVDDRLGTNSEAWIVALRLFPEFTGTIPELLATASAMTDSPTPE